MTTVNTVKSHFKKTVVWRLGSPSNDHDYLVKMPNTLFIHVDGHVDWSVFSGHAWGRASVSSDPDGNVPYPVEHLRLRIIMHTPEQQFKITQADSASVCDNDVVWAGASPIFSGPNTSFDAYADDPTYGSWAVSIIVN